jgi:hypothetical protein
MVGVIRPGSGVAAVASNAYSSLKIISIVGYCGQVGLRNKEDRME